MRVDLNPEIERNERFNFTLKALESDYLHGSMTEADTVKKLKGLREIDPEQGAIADFYEADIIHGHVSNVDTRYGRYLVDYATNLGKTSYTLSRSEVENAQDKFPEMAELKEDEEKATALYESAAKTDWDRRLYDILDAQGMYLGLTMRKVQRTKNERLRNKRLDELEKKQTEFYKKIANSGKKNEYQLIWLIQKYARKQGLDHIISAEHGRAREDLRDKIDVILTIGGERFDIQLKTFSFDSNVKEYNQAILEATRKKLQGTGVRDVVLDVHKFNDLVKEEEEGQGDVHRQQALIRDIAGFLPNGRAKKVFEGLKQVGAWSEETKERKKERDLHKVLNKEVLVKADLATKEDFSTAERANDFRKRIEALVVELLDNDEITMRGLKTMSDEVKEKIQKALEK
ncbi:MAG: hypothetical protein Q8P30_02905 [Candidatus Uhrbacteria bacterium]|nr:hypothetical protein [Candidatus Uhrbacteria bacterium]